MKKDNYRLVRVKDEIGYFHGWESYAYVVNAGLTVGSHPAGQISQTYGIIEFPDRVSRVDPGTIVFVDDINADLWSMNKHYKEDQTLKKIEQMGDMLKETI